jgi:signal transduction histidine kinase
LAGVRTRRCSRCRWPGPPHGVGARRWLAPGAPPRGALTADAADAVDRSPVPVDVALDLPGRLPPPVEAAAYFVVCEALANVARHSGAGRARVEGGHRGGRLVLTVSDDGDGGADPAAGSGLTGLADRVSVLDGRLSLSSPRGGPTLLRVEIRCEPSQPPTTLPPTVLPAGPGACA